MQVKDDYCGRLDHASLRNERRIIAVVANRRIKGVQGCGSVMIKDIVANLSVGVSRDVVTEFAVSVSPPCSIRTLRESPSATSRSCR